MTTKRKYHYAHMLLVLLFAFLMASPTIAQRPDKVQQMKDRRAAEGTSKVDQGLTDALALAKKQDLASWKSAKKKVAEARDALIKLEGSAATRDNQDTKSYRANMNVRVKKIYDAANTWLPAKLTEKPRADKYTGGDKEKISKAIKDAWANKWPTDQILAVRLGRADWKHTVEKNAAGAVIKDHQFLEVSVYVKESSNIATGYPAYYNKDNLTKAETTGVATKSAQHISHDVKASAF